MIDSYTANKILHGLSLAQANAYSTSVNFGYWEKPRNLGEVLALIHVNLSKATQVVYKRPELASMSEKIPDYTQLEEELADAIIRIFDLGIGCNLNIAAAILAKLNYNHNLAAHLSHVRESSTGNADEQSK